MTSLSRAQHLPPLPGRRRRRRECAIGAHVLWLVFLHLPLKSLFRCKAVCKAFYSVVSDPIFTADYRRSYPRISSGEPACAGFFVEYGLPECVSLAACGGNYGDRNPSEKELRFSIRPNRSSMRSRRIPPYYENRIIASSSGILLCGGIKFTPESHCRRYEYYVMNPLTKEWRSLPHWPKLIDPSSSMIEFVCQEGDPSIREYHYNYEVMFVHKRDKSYVIGTYSNRSDKWSVAFCPSKYPGVYLKIPGKITKIHGVCYWTLEVSESLTILTSYDFAIGKVEESPLPVSLDINTYRHLCIGDGANGALQLSANDEQGFDVWVKADCSQAPHPWWRKHRIQWHEIKILAYSPSFGVEEELFMCYSRLKVDAFFPGDHDKVLIILASQPLAIRAVFVYDLINEKLEMLHFRQNYCYSFIRSCYPYHLPSWHFRL